MLKICFFTLFLMISGVPFGVIAQSLPDRLKQGDQAIGFKLIYTCDYGRTFLAERAENQYGPRRLQISVWYPAEASAEESSIMTYGDYEEVVKAFEFLMDAYPDTQDSYPRLGEAHMVHGDRDIGLTLLRKALEMKPDDPAVKQILQRVENR
jgi:tetratricopeptide (TPR) repeat protein